MLMSDVQAIKFTAMIRLFNIECCNNKQDFVIKEVTINYTLTI